MENTEELTVLTEKDEQINPDHKEILNHWNSKEIVIHKFDKKGLKRRLRTNLKEHTKEEIKLGIDHYAAMYFDPDYKYCKYKWTLSRLLYQENGIAEFFDDGHKWISYCQFKDKQSNKESKVLPEQQVPAFSLPDYNDIEEMYMVVIAALKSMDYKEYIKTEHWQHFRKEALKHFNNTCQLCNANDVTLDVHHKTYINRGRETFNDVVVLCRHCHDLYHHNKDHCTCPRCSGEEGEHQMQIM